jgi:hypothetical protein
MSNYNGHEPKPFISKDQVKLWMRDTRYSGKPNEQDPAFQAYVVACMDLTDGSVLGISTPKAAPEMQHYLQQGRPTIEGAKWQDINNTLGTMSDCYRDMSEASADMRTQLYKTSAFERQRVAEKIDRSTPDSSVEGPARVNGSIQLMPEPEPVEPWHTSQEEGN